MRPRKPRTPSCATSWEPNSGKTPSAGGRGSGPAADERERTRKPPGPHTSTKAWLQPYARKTHGTGAALFCLRTILRKNEAGRTFLSGPRTFVEPTTGFEPVTCALRERCFYQLSHVGTRLLAKREYELYRRACRFARGKCNFSGEQAGIAVSPQACTPSVAALESRMGTLSTAAAIVLESCTDLRPSVGV